jgi:hypothetical protein
MREYYDDMSEALREVCFCVFVRMYARTRDAYVWVWMKEYDDDMSEAL